MKNLEIPYVPNLTLMQSMTAVSELMDSLERNSVEIVSWKAFQYKPEVSFSIAYNGELFLKFYVKENNIKALYRNSNDPVYKDSCVEFFVAFNDSNEYYNFEFNCLGTCLLGYGRNKEVRKLISPKIIKQIRAETLIKSQSLEGSYFVAWELTLAIPLSVFCFHSFKSFNGQLAKANFYKCGDETQQKHYLAWNSINTEEPDFHQPTSFGNLFFTTNQYLDE